MRRAAGPPRRRGGIDPVAWAGGCLARAAAGRSASSPCRAQQGLSGTVRVRPPGDVGRPAVGQRARPPSLSRYGVGAPVSAPGWQLSQLRSPQAERRRSPHSHRQIAAFQGRRLSTTQTCRRAMVTVRRDHCLPPSTCRGPALALEPRTACPSSSHPLWLAHRAKTGLSRHVTTTHPEAESFHNFG